MSNTDTECVLMVPPTGELWRAHTEILPRDALERMLSNGWTWLPSCHMIAPGLREAARARHLARLP